MHPEWTKAARRSSEGGKDQQSMEHPPFVSASFQLILLRCLRHIFCLLTLINCKQVKVPRRDLFFLCVPESNLSRGLSFKSQVYKMRIGHHSDIYSTGEKKSAD